MEKNEAGLYEVHIDDKVYEFSKWGAEDSLDTMIDIAGIVGGPLGEVVSQIVEGGLDKEFDPAMIMNVVESLTSNIAKDKTISKALIKKLTSDRVMCDGKKINFNEHYREDMIHMFKVVKAGVEVQYGNFFDALYALLPKRKKKVLQENTDT